MSKYGIQTKGTGAVMGRSSYAVGGRAADPRRKLGPSRPKTGRPSIPEFPRKPSPGPKGGPRKPSPGPKGGLEKLKKKQRQADYMKKHGKKAPRRKTLSVTNSYKKEVEGLK